MIVRTDAIVLHAFDYGETSKIVRLLTRPHGVIGVMARGARRPTSTFGSTLQPMSYLQAVYYHRPQRGLQTLKETAHVVRFKQLTSDIHKVTLGLRVVEVTRSLVEEGEAHPLILDHVVRTLEHIDEAEANAANAVPWFQLRLASLLGFAPDIQRDDVQALGDDGGRLLLRSGAVLAAGAEATAYGLSSTADGVDASRAALRAFAILAKTDLATAGRMRLAPEVRAEVEGLVDAYVRVHTESSYPDRVRGVADQMDTYLARSRGGAEGM
ncbi:DNA repair protein RecO [Rubrivirga sp. IMCC43871]|uniref:DNA repair protein RecO n=1 Tax=Rubrivirga sp. IMCC43871 TaxID=3391575 RepID=UPI00399024E9